jgi:hypothetical protein
MTLDEQSLAAKHVGQRPTAKLASVASIQPGSKLWVMARRDPDSKSAVVRRFAKYSG